MDILLAACIASINPLNTQQPPGKIPGVFHNVLEGHVSCLTSHLDVQVACLRAKLVKCWHLVAPGQYLKAAKPITKLSNICWKLFLTKKNCAQLTK